MTQPAAAPRVPKPLSPFEAIVRARLETILGVPVRQMDNGSQNATPDLLIDRPGRAAAVEIVRDADEDTVEQANVLGARGLIIPAPRLGHSWGVELTPRASIKAAHKDLPALLEEAEQAGDRVLQGLRWKGISPRGYRLFRLGIHRADCGAPADPEGGHIFLLQVRSGTWDLDMDVIPAWCEAFLAEAADVPAKLAGSGFGERHAVLAASSFGDMAAWRALHAATVPTLPQADPELPEGVDQVWAWGERILHWAPGTGWRDRTPEGT